MKLFHIFFLILFISCNPSTYNSTKDNFLRSFFNTNAGKKSPPSLFLTLKGKIADSNSKPVKNISIQLNSSGIDSAIPELSVRNASGENELICTDYNLKPGEVTCIFNLQLPQYQNFQAPIRLSFTGNGKEIAQIASFNLFRSSNRFILNTKIPDESTSFTLFNGNTQLPLTTIAIEDFMAGSITDDKGNYSFTIQAGKKYILHLKSPEKALSTIEINLENILTEEQLKEIIQNPSLLPFQISNNFQNLFTELSISSSNINTVPSNIDNISNLDYYKDPASSNTSISLPTVFYSPSTQSLTVGSSSTISPTVSGTVNSFSISPSLPSGLSFNSSTGLISGTPSVSLSSTVFTVTATNIAGSVSTSLTLSILPINPDPPSSLSYSSSSNTFLQGVSISSLNPVVTGTVTSYSVNPALPTGLSLNTSTGVISGTPSATQAASSYTITASNTAGSTNTSILIIINPQAPSVLIYSGSPFTFTINAPINPQNPVVTGTVTSYSVNPALPTGLSLNTSTGAINGTPSAIQGASSYTVTATNVTGSTNTSISITVNSNPPSGLNYSGNTFTFIKNTAISPQNPTVTGTVTSYSVSPTLPSGLSLNTSTGVISGTPSATQVASSYTVTATNAYGNTTVSISITINDAPPSSLSYTAAPFTFTQGIAISPQNPVVTGTVTSYSVNPALPSGLSLNTSTGVISGTPSATQGVSSYTVTATNSSGSTNTSVSITIIIPAPSSLSYSAAPFTFTQGIAISPQNPVVTGTVTSYSVNPALPSGLSLNTSTGVISGTPSATQGASSYTVTATNSSGSTNTSISITINGVPTLSGSRLLTRLSGASGGTVKAYGLVVDSAGNVFVGGTTNIAFDSQTITGSTDIFVIKYDSSGTKQWTKFAGASGKATEGLALAIDAGGNVYSAGYTFGAFNGVTCPAKNNQSCGYIIKYNTSGAPQWTVVHNLSSGNNARIESIAVSGTSVYVAGYATDGWNGLSCVNICTILSSYNTETGAHNWSQVIDAGNTNYIGKGIAVDGSGNIIITGYTYATIDTKTCTSTPCPAIAQYNSSGVRQWSDVIDVYGFSYATAIDSSGNSYIGGYIKGGTSIDSQNCSLTSIYYCYTLMKYNSSGIRQWSRVNGTTSKDAVTQGISSDGVNVYLTGYTTGGLNGQTQTGTRDIFLIKYASDGTLGWTYQAGVAGQLTDSFSIFYNSNNLYTGGYTTGALNGESLNGSYDAFFEKYQ
ncbi:MAG: putative Ig domain-containing protein [Leptospiraceae bacterium]|nr:putative Ig domain-containing protein [Leptospiraceae bacterium]